MYDGASLSEPTLLQRAVGDLRIAVKRRGRETVLDDLRQDGCLKARFPRRADVGWMDIVMLNTGGGVAGGDRLKVTVDVGPEAKAIVTTQAAERFYRIRTADSPSQVRTRLAAAGGAALEWLPQETILFDQSDVDRQLDVDLAPSASFLAVENLVFGRTLMGERIGHGRLRDLIRIRRGTELLLHDAIRIDGNIDAKLQRAAIGGGARAIATIVYIAPDIPDKLSCLRSSWRDESQPALPQAECAASTRNGVLIARIAGRDSAVVRQSVIAALHILRDDRALPRAWLC